MNNLKAMHDAFVKHNSTIASSPSGIKTEISDGTLMPKKVGGLGKPQTPLQHQSVEKAAKASAAARSIPEGIAAPKVKPGFGPAKFGTKKVY